MGGDHLVEALAHFRVQRFVVTLRAVDRVTLPWFAGSALRGGFGHAFRRLACAMGPQQPCQTCPLRQTCPYGYVFETGPAPDSDVLRTHQEVPRPFVMKPPGRDGRPVGTAAWVVGDERRALTFEEGQPFRFEFVLVGRGIDYFPYFVVALRELGVGGVGARRARFSLEDVYCLRLPDEAHDGGPGEPEPPEEGLAVSEPAGNSAGRVAVRVYEKEGQRIKALPPPLTGAQLADYGARQLGGDHGRLAVRFMTMTALKHAGRMVTRPVFHVLVRATLRRLSSLSYFHHGCRLELDYPGLIRLAEHVELEADETRWVRWRRWSSRQEQSMDFSGLVGRAIYRGPLGPLLPILALAEWLHVGKHATFGLGAIRLGWKPE